LTDAPPRRNNLQRFLDSDRTRSIPLPAGVDLPQIAAVIESAMAQGASTDVRRSCDAFLATVADFYKVPHCGIKVLAARPLRVRKYPTSDVAGVFQPSNLRLHLWIPSSARTDITSIGTFL